MRGAEEVEACCLATWSEVPAAHRINTANKGLSTIEHTIVGGIIYY